MARPNQSVYVRPLKRGERKRLERLAKRGRDARLVNRARVILLSYQRKRVPEISNLLDMAETCVADWIRRYEAEGIDGLHDRPRSGRPRKADATYEKRLLELVQSDPQRIDPDCPWSVWTLERLRARMEHEGFASVCDDTVRGLLHRHQFAFLRPKLDLKHKQDPRAVNRFKRRVRAVKKGWMPIPA